MVVSKLHNILYWVIQIVFAVIILYVWSSMWWKTITVGYFTLLAFLLGYGLYRKYSDLSKLKTIERSIFDMFIVLYWSIYMFVFSSSYTAIWLPSKVNDTIVYYLIGWLLLGIFISFALMRKYLWLIMLITIPILHIYLYSIWYVFNISHHDYW